MVPFTPQGWTTGAYHFNIRLRVWWTCPTIVLAALPRAPFLCLMLLFNGMTGIAPWNFRGAITSGDQPGLEKVTSGLQISLILDLVF